MDLTKALFKGDRVIWAVFFFLCIISLIEVYSASSMLSFKSSVRHFDPIIRHATFLLGGTGLIFLIQNINIKKLPIIGGYILIIAIVFLVYAQLGGMRVNDAQRWVSLFGISFQPSEFAKLGLIITSAYFLGRFQGEDNASEKAFKIVSVMTLVFCLLIVKENFSTAFLLSSVIYIMMFIGRVELKKLGYIALAGFLLIASVVLIIPHLPKKVLKETRLQTWVNRFERKTEKHADFKITDENQQVSYGKIAIANGGVFGLMPGNSKTRDILPQAYSDFIFAIILEETGLIGGAVVIFLYFILLFRVGIIARRCNRAFPALVIIGCALIIVFQAIINMSVAVNLIPVTGQPLPLISRGGTSTVISCIYFGIILSVSQYANECVAEKKSKEEAIANGTEPLLVPEAAIQEEDDDLI